MQRRGTEEVDARRMGSPAREGNRQEGRQARGVGDGVLQAVPKALVTNSPAGTIAAIGKPADQHHQLQSLVVQKEKQTRDYRDRAKKAEQKLMLVTEEKVQMQLKIDALTDEVNEKTAALIASQGINKFLKRKVEGLNGRTDLTAFADEPARGAAALACLRPGGVAAGPPRFTQVLAQWLRYPGTLRDAHMYGKRGACACKRELAENGLAKPFERFEDMKVLGQGGFGIVHRGRCKLTKTVFAIKLFKPGNDATCLARELAAFAIMGSHKNLISVEALSDVKGSEGLVMELAYCDLYQASTQTSGPALNTNHTIDLLANGTEGLSFMRSLGVVHCDQKLVNVLVCRGDGPGGFVGKVTDPGVWCGVGEARAAKFGTVGRVPLENVLGEVAAAPDQDVFAVGVDACFILANPAWRTSNDNLWAHQALLTAEERDRGIALHGAGADMSDHRDKICERTMTDGSLSLILLQPQLLNPILPPTELERTCKVLQAMVSPNPEDRGEMADATSFLRDLAAKTTAHINEFVAATLAARVAVPPVIEHPPAVEAPVIAPAPEFPAAGLVGAGGGRSGGASVGGPSVERVHLAPPPVAAQHAEGEAGNGSGPPAARPPVAVEVAEVANLVMPSLEGIAPGVPCGERVHLAPPPVVGLHVGGARDGAGVAVPGAEAAEASRGSAPPSVDPPAGAQAAGVARAAGAAEAANGVMPSLGEIAAGVPSVERVHLAPLPYAAHHAEGEGIGANASVPPAEAVQAPRGSAPHGSGPLAAAAGPAAISLLAPVVATHADEEEDDAGAAVPPARAVKASNGSAPPGSPLPAADPPVAAQPLDESIPSLEEINTCVEPLFRPFPRSPAEVMANHMADTLRTPRCPPPGVARLLAQQAYRGGGGGGSSGGSGGSGGGGGGGEGRVVIGGRSRGVLPGSKGVKKQGPVVAGSRPFWKAECFFLTKFW